METSPVARQAVQLLFPGFRFGTNDPAQAVRLVKMGVGGFCLYAGTAAKVAELTTELQSHASHTLLFCADYEDGLPSHCADGTALPSNMGIGAAGSEDLAFRKGAITARESRAVGVDWVLAPVLDLANEPANPIVNIRSFSRDPREVERLASAYLRGLRSQGALSCVKHFPGHGRARQDSHLKMPLLDLTRAEMESADMVPFTALAAKTDGVMTGHLDIPALTREPGLPYSLSGDVAKTLRGRLGFQGVVMTDALHMGAVSERFSELEAAKRALLGGSDILLVPRDPASLARDLGAALEKEPALREAVLASHARLEKARGAALQARPRAGLEEVGGSAHVKEAEKMAAACLAWSGRPIKPVPKIIFYLEPETTDPQKWRGMAFVETLRKEGVEVKPWGTASSGEPLVIGSFAGPRAWTGRIGYDEDTLSGISRGTAGAAARMVVSFGSPFVFEGLGGEGLCAFSRQAPAQKAAALALAGRIPVTGRMPV